MTVVGVIGLGDIGRGVASAVARAGLELAVCDIRAEATEPFAALGRVASGPAELAELSDVVIVAVVNDEQVMSVLSAASLRPGTTVVVLSTISPATVRQVGELAGAAGAAVVACGVSGGPVAAAEGKLVAMVGGADGDIERVLPVLESFSSLVVRMGPLGAGLQAKLARNIVQYGSWLAAYEAQRLAEAAGIKLSRLADAIKASDPMIGGPTRLMFRPTVAPFGPDDDAGIVGAMRNGCALSHKDLRAALELAGELGVDLPLAALADGQMDSVFGFGPGQ